MPRQLPFDVAFIRQIAEEHPTPFYLYDERAIRANAQRLIAAFSWCPTFKNYFAVKATPNPHILAILREEGFGADCSSLTELLLCRSVGMSGRELMFTSNNTPAAEFSAAHELHAIINLDDVGHVSLLQNSTGMPTTLSFRYNPGSDDLGNAIIGRPNESKFGLTKEQLFDGYRQARQLGVDSFGLHTMVVSNELNVDRLATTAQMLFKLCVEIRDRVGIELDFVNLGGGIGIPYQPDESPVDFVALSTLVKQYYESTIVAAGLDPLNIFTENGRAITGPFGYLVTQVAHLKQTHKSYVGVDACMAHLMRPGMYGAYHHVTVLGKETANADCRYDIVGSLCENNDKFAIDREFPQIETGDFLVIHDAGAHGHSMGFQYNGKLRCAELLMQADGTIRQIRRAESPSDYFATLDYPGLNETSDSSDD